MIILLCWEFFTPVIADGFSLEFEWQQVSSSLRDTFSVFWPLFNAVDWLVSTCLLISKSSSSFTNLLGIVPSAPIIIDITVTFMFFFSSLSRSRYLSLFSLSFDFTLSLKGWQSQLFSRFSFFFFFFLWLSLGLVVWPILGDLFVSQNPREPCVSHSLRQIPDCTYITCLYCQTTTTTYYYYYYYYYYYTLWVFIPVAADDYHWKLSNSQSPKNSSIFIQLFIVVVFLFYFLVVVCMVSVPPWISISFIFFSFLGLSRSFLVLQICSALLLLHVQFFYLVICSVKAKFIIFLLIIIRPGFLI